jgi:hypothetical protein
MDCWHPIAVRAEMPDVVQQWAALEAKSASMREELAQRFEPRKRARRLRPSNVALCGELIAIALKAWWHIYGG